MGSVTFGVLGGGKTAETAFNKLRDMHLKTHGNRGYTGTIAEKQSFVMISLPSTTVLKGTIEEKCKLAQRESRALIDARDKRIDDKYGPAGCIQVSATKWYFFGWAAE